MHFVACSNLGKVSIESLCLMAVSPSVRPDSHSILSNQADILVCVPRTSEQGVSEKGFVHKIEL